MDPRIERTRRVVRLAALEELAEAGYGSFTIESVAGRCGVARSTIYRHWPDKVTLIADAFDTLNQQPGPASRQPEAPRERIRVLLTHLAEAMSDSVFARCLPALVDAAARQPELAAFLHAYNERRRGALTAAIRDAVHTGEVATTVQPELAGLALAGTIIYRRLMTAEPFDPADVDALITTVLSDAPRRRRAAAGS
jgi:TetR/AcrR family transcriptional regulator of autoinduction and epiphytic fitness